MCSEVVVDAAADAALFMVLSSWLIFNVDLFALVVVGRTTDRDGAKATEDWNEAAAKSNARVKCRLIVDVYVV